MFVYQKWPKKIFPTVNFIVSHDGHFGLGAGGGGRGGGQPPLPKKIKQRPGAYPLGPRWLWRSWWRGHGQSCLGGGRGFGNQKSIRLCTKSGPNQYPLLQLSLFPAMKSGTPPPPSHPGDVELLSKTRGAAGSEAVPLCAVASPPGETALAEPTWQPRGVALPRVRAASSRVTVCGLSTHRQRSSVESLRHLPGQGIGGSLSPPPAHPAPMGR